MTDNEKMREEFETWARTQGLDITDRSGLFYMNLHTFIAWNAWKAAQYEQSAELERLRKDAERYQWLRDDAFEHSADCFFEAGQLFAGHQGDSFDVAVDAAIVRAAAAIGEGMK